MRRSGRSRKQREFFKPFEGIPEHDSADEEDDYEEEVASDEERDRGKSRSSSMQPPKGRMTLATSKTSTTSVVVANVVHKQNNRSRQSTGTAITAASSAQAAAGGRRRGGKAASVAAQFAYDGPRCALFDALLGTGDTSNAVRSVVGMFESNHIAAVAEVINFVLLSGGAHKKWIGSRVELEGLEPEELDELLRDMVVETTSRESITTPLQLPAQTVSNKSSAAPVSIRVRFGDIWAQFVEAVNSPLTQSFNMGQGGSSQKQGANDQAGVEILDMVVSVLVALSSSGLANIRDAVTETALCIGQNVLSLVTANRGKRDVATRQLKAEEQKGKNNKLTPKYKSIQKQVARHEEAMEEFTRLSQLLFNSIFAHRYKDSNEQIRANCTRQLGQWLLRDPVRLFEDTYLKYLGWMCSDRSSSVRLEAILSISRLCDETDSVSLLESFLERFINRILVMAAQDVDHHVSLAAISCLRKAQVFGALDEVSGEAISRVDGIVFDQWCPCSVRAEALRFMMEHTEGFEFLLAAPSTSTAVSSSSKHRKSTSKSEAAATSSSLESRRNVLLALETVTEFMDDVYTQHASPEDDGEGTQEGRLCHMADLLVGAFRALPEPMSSLLFDWDAMVSLLLKESDVFTSGYALQEFHAAALLQLMLESAKSVYNSIHDGQVSDKWSQLVAVLHSNLLRLFTRFQDSEKNLFILASFLTYVDLSHGVKTAQLFLKATSDIFFRSHYPALTFRITSAWCEWAAKATAGSGTEVSGGGPVGRSIRESIAQVADSLRDTLMSGRDGLKSAVLGAFTSSNKRRSKGNVTPIQLDDQLLSVSLAADKLSSLLKSVDCRGTSDDDVLEALGGIADISADLIDNCDEGKKAISAAAVTTLVCCVRCVNAMMLWPAAKFMTAAGNNADTTDIVDNVQHTRDILVDILQKCLNVGNSETVLSKADANMLTNICSMRRESFAIIGDMRVLFYPINEAWHWLPSHDMVQAMRGVFDLEVLSLKKDLAACEGGSSIEERNQTEKISKLLCNTLLYPLETVLVFDCDNLNRRQGAAVISFMAEENDTVVEIVKVWCKKLKEIDVVKYLEVQMVSLKSIYADKLWVHLNQLRDADQLESQSNYSTEVIAELEAFVQEGITYLHRFTQRISQTFGVGKLKGDAASALVLFFKAGIDYMMSDPANLSFAASLELYVRFLTPHYLADIATYLQNVITSPTLSEDMLALLEHDFRDSPEQVWVYVSTKAYNSLVNSLSKKGGVDKSNLDISEITRDTNRTRHSFMSSKAIVKPARRGKLTDNSRPSIESATSSVATSVLHSHTKEYGSKRRRSDSITSNASSGLEDVFPSPTRAVTKTTTKRALSELSEEEEEENIARQNGKEAKISSHSKPSRIFEDRRHVDRRPVGSAPNAKKQKVATDTSANNGRNSAGGRRSTRSSGSAKSYTDQLYDMDEAGRADDDVVYGLHIEDPDEGTDRTERQGRGGTRSGDGLITEKLSSALFSEESDASVAGYESDGSSSIIVPPSTRNRNR